MSQSLTDSIFQVINKAQESNMAALRNAEQAMLQNREIMEMVKSFALSLPDDKRQEINIYVQNITQGDQVMNKNEVRMGDHTNINGDFVVANSIKNSFNKIATSQAPDELKELLKELSNTINKILEQLPKDESKDIVEDLDKLVDEAVKEKPKRKYWEVSVNGLKDAAEKLGEIGKPVLDLISKIAPLLIALSG